MLSSPRVPVQTTTDTEPEPESPVIQKRKRKRKLIEEINIPQRLSQYLKLKPQVLYMTEGEEDSQDSIESETPIPPSPPKPDPILTKPKRGNCCHIF